MWHPNRKVPLFTSNHATRIYIILFSISEMRTQSAERRDGGLGPKPNITDQADVGQHAESIPSVIAEISTLTHDNRDNYRTNDERSHAQVTARAVLVEANRRNKRWKTNRSCRRSNIRNTCSNSRHVMTPNRNHCVTFANVCIL